MPLNVRRFYFSIPLGLAVFLSVSHAQVVAPSSATAAVAQPPVTQPAVPAPTSGDVMRDRITKAKAYIAVRNYNAAIYELENIRKETADPAVQGVVNVLLMNSYLEQGDYKRAQEFLNRFYAEQKTTKAGAIATYSSIAGQVVSGARNRAERFKALGLDPTNRTLPLEALNDLQNMRDTLELVVTQAKEIGQTTSKTPEAMALLEEATNSRAMLARDQYDAKRWRDEVGDIREAMTTGKVLTATTQDGVNGAVAETPNPLNPSQPIVNKPTSQQQTSATQPVFQPTTNTADPAARPRVTPENTAPAQPTYIPATTTLAVDQPQTQPVSNAATQQPNQPNKTQTPAQQRTPNVQQPAPAPAETAKTDAPKDNSPVDVGSSLMSYATSKPNPVVPPAAKAIRQSGVVRVDITVDEKGDVEVQKASGPSLLVAAARDAIKKWKFRPYMRDGQAVKVSGYVNFNFAL